MPDQDKTEIIKERQALVRQRAVPKRRITNVLNSVAADPSPHNVTGSIKLINEYLAIVKRFDETIIQLLCDETESTDLSGECLVELDLQEQYALSIQNKLAALEATEENNPSTGTSEPGPANCKLKLPELKVESFSGEGVSHMQFHAFKTQYNNVIGLREDLSASTKFTYLKSYLKGYALKLVQHLQVNDENYAVALQLLESEFLNEKALVNDLIRKLMDLKLKSDPTYLETKIFINDARCVIADLKVYNYDLLKEKSANAVVSNVIFSKLPSVFQQELIRKVDDNYPSVQQVFENYVEVINILNLKKSKAQMHLEESVDSSGLVNRTVAVADSKPKKFLANFKGKQRFCKLCASTGHSMVQCNRYVGFAARKKRCVELRLCSKCSSQAHTSNECNVKLEFPCSTCGSNSHITALCQGVVNRVTSSNFCVNASSDAGTTFLLPTMSIPVNFGNRTVRVRFLIDTGSQRSYVSTSVLRQLNMDVGEKSDMLINTFVDKAFRGFSETALTIELPEKRKCVLPFLVNDDFNLQFTIEGLKVAHENVGKKFKLMEKLRKDEIYLDGLLGVDAIQCFTKCEIISCLGGTALKFSSGIVPFGNVDNFLTNEQLESKYSVADGKEKNLSSQLVNFVLNPNKIYFDPIGSSLEDSGVEERIDKLFSVESLGISEKVEEYDEKMIREFEAGIEKFENRYFVELPWTDKITRVDHNFDVSVAILNRVIENLKSKGLYKDYGSVIRKQVDEGILEEICIDDIDVRSHVWIPHRAVLKAELGVTTKLRIVLNCSIKRGNSVSLNEAAYPGVNLTSNLLELLVKLRSETYLVMADVRAAFLMIQLKKESDKNKFSIVWRNEEGKLLAFRYRTIVFGFVASPFILQNVIRYHVSSYPDDRCSRLLKENMYVDNLFFSGNDSEELLKLYEDACNRMAEGGFELRSWSTNCAQLEEQFQADNRVPPEKTDPKVLGYRYNSETDQLKLENLKFESEKNCTKRNILACTAQVFDPLGFTLPVTVSTKRLLRQLWKLKLDWDEDVPEELAKEWLKIKEDLKRLSTITFNRKAYQRDVELFVFCDSSKILYGFTCYARYKSGEDIDTGMIFAKAKIAPIKEKSLPTLELLAVFLAMKCLPTILTALESKVKHLTIAVDAQVVLSWILTSNVKSKNVFAKNRVKDIDASRTEIKQKFDIDCKFRYVPTEGNPADLLTRGISFHEFISKKTEWLHGPEFLREEPCSWPDRELSCLSAQSKVLTGNLMNCQESILPVEKYSSQHKLLKVTSLVILFVSKLKRAVKSRLKCYEDARKYWINHEQAKHLSREIKFLREDPRSKNVPNLVKNLNLFLDDEEIVRSRGRISHCSRLSEDIKHPILMPRESFLTELLIFDIHERCKHLGVSSTLTAVRMAGFWIPKGRSTVKKVLNSCVSCRKFNALPFRYPKPNDLVRDKVHLVDPYDHTGIDFTGQVFVKLGGEVRRVYILVFTCLNIRAVHLEVLPDMSCQQFLLAFVRFTNAHNIPSSIYSDNASTFIQALGILSETSLDNDFSDYMLKYGIKHVRIPLYAAWVGSAWERLIGTIKTAIHKVIGRKRVDYFEFISVLSDIQQAINSRPLTYRSEDDLTNSICPNSFLKPDRGRSVLFGSVEGSEIPAVSRKDLVATLERREQIYEEMKTLWYEEYLTALRESARDLYQSEWEDSVKVGDIVLISSPNKPKPMWQMGRILALLPGKDGITRTVQLRRPDGTDGVYAIKSLYPLELAMADTRSEKCTEDHKVQHGVAARQVPVRAAARKCLQAIKGSN